MHLRTVSLVLVLALAAAACETDTPTAEERAVLEPLVRTFLIQLAAAYAEMDPKPLEGIGAPRLLERARHDIDLLKAGGDRLEPVLVEVTITSMKVLRHANAYLTCTEVWDTRRFDAFTGELIGQDVHSVLHSSIQLKKLEGRWLVLYREVEETRTGPRLALPTRPPA
ncbi:MAG: hypothetical protein HXY19_07710 [Thermoanaerobaculaceae bacterium]|nr:hypothetical protein [Thermoanaerobaculaceae bacterium]